MSEITEKPKFTPGPWRWEVVPSQKSVLLMSDSPGRPCVMDFSRWGWNGAQPLFPNWEWANTLQSVTTWTSPEGVLDHPNARLMSAAPDMYAALSLGVPAGERTCDGPRFLRAVAAQLHDLSPGHGYIDYLLRKADAEEAALAKAQGKEG